MYCVKDWRQSKRITEYQQEMGIIDDYRLDAETKRLDELFRQLVFAQGFDG